MSQENVKLHHRAIEAFNTRDVETFIAVCNAQIEFHSAFGAVGGGIYHGHDGVRSWHRDFEDAWGTQIRIEPEAYFDLGEHTPLVSFAARAWKPKRRGGRDAQRRR